VVLAYPGAHVAMASSPRPTGLLHFRRWLPLVAIGVVAVIRATATARDTAPAERPLALAEQQRIFAIAAAREPALRVSTAQSFLGDPWSANDDFHNNESRLAMQLAAQHRVSRETILRIIDDGLREGWPGSEMMQRSVPPCHPRPND